MSMRNICFKCKHSKKVFNSSHVECCHINAQMWKSSSKHMHNMMVHLVQGKLPYTAPMNIKAAETGLEEHYFHFPYNFDPRWLLNCDCYEEK